MDATGGGLAATGAMPAAIVAQLWGGAGGGAELAPVDVLLGAILVLAGLRGLMKGLIREAFSIAALGGALIAIRLFTDPLAVWLRDEVGIAADGFLLRVVAAAVLLVGVVGGVVLAGRTVRRGARAAGLGWADRLGGGVLGTAEGMLVAGLLLSAAIAAMGRDHAWLSESRSLAALDEARRVAARADQPPDVAAPPPQARR